MRFTALRLLSSLSLVLLLSSPLARAATSPTANNPSPVNFGTQAVGSAKAQVSVSFMITGTGTLATSPVVLTQGTAGLDFTLGTSSTCTGTVTRNSTCKVNIVFTPKAPGQRLGAVQLMNTSGGVVATALLYGTGAGAAAAFPGPQGGVPLGSGFQAPFGVAVDSAGDVFVADFIGNAVKEILAVNGSVPANPIIHTLGSGFSAPASVAVDGVGNVWVADYGSNAIKELVAVNGSIPATNPTIRVWANPLFTSPLGVTVDGIGNVFVADSTSGGSVEEMSPVNGAYSTANPNIRILSGGFSNPGSVAVDLAGNVYVADKDNSAIKEILAVNGTVPSANPTVLTLSTNDFGHPSHIAVDAAGDVFATDPDHNLVKEMVAVNGAVPTSNPTVLTLGTGFISALGVAIDPAGNVYVADYWQPAVYMVPLTTPATLVFPQTQINSVSPAQTFQMQNVGNMALTLPVPASGQNPSMSPYFTLANSSSCPLVYSSSSNPGSLASGALCTESVTYTPTMDGSVTGNLVFTDNSLTNTQTAVMTGTSSASLTMTVANATVANTDASDTLTFILGWGGNTAPVGLPTLTISGNSSIVSGIACAGKAGHENCTATLNPSSLQPGTYTITATEAANGNYSQISGAATLTVTGTKTGPSVKHGR